MFAAGVLSNLTCNNVNNKATGKQIFQPLHPFFPTVSKIFLTENSPG